MPAHGIDVASKAILMNEQERALLSAAADAPDDDAPRRAYADWLDANGRSEQAEFVRLQLAAAALPWWHIDRPRLEERAEALERQHRDEWLRRLGVDPRKPPPPTRR